MRVISALHHKQGKLRYSWGFKGHSPVAATEATPSTCPGLPQPCPGWGPGVDGSSPSKQDRPLPLPACPIPAGRASVHHFPSRKWSWCWPATAYPCVWQKNAKITPSKQKTDRVDSVALLPKAESFLYVLWSDHPLAPPCSTFLTSTLVISCSVPWEKPFRAITPVFNTCWLSKFKQPSHRGTLCRQVRSSNWRWGWRGTTPVWSRIEGENQMLLILPSGRSLVP